MASEFDQHSLDQRRQVLDEGIGGVCGGVRSLINPFFPRLKQSVTI